MNYSIDPRGLEDRLRQHVVALASSPREPGSLAHTAAQDYINLQLRAAGFVYYGIGRV